MLNTEVVYANLPPHIKGVLVRMFDEEDYYTIVINSNLNIEQQREAYEHEVRHYRAKDFEQTDKSVDEIECIRHY